MSMLQERPDGVTVDEVTAAIGMPRGTIVSYLSTLRECDYVEYDHEARLYRVGLGFVGMQSRSLEVLRVHARPWLQKLRDEFGETINLGLLDGDSVIYLDIAESRRRTRMAATRGGRANLHSSALGKAIAAGLPKNVVREILKQAEMPKQAANTITTISRFLHDLADVRRRGYAVDDMEHDPDGRCVAVPIPGTRLPVAISLSAPASRFPLDNVEKVAGSLANAARRMAASNTPEPPTGHHHR